MKTEKQLEEFKKAKLLKLLQKGWQLSKLQILVNIKLFNSGNAVYRLRKEGHLIKTRMEVNKSTGSRFAVYYIEN